ncbi:hypothetical protein AGMMS4952_12330 [Spirochaetia bacterium]|nr:hypothetical protein AGMMS4952_12330 [Spirochaetia bacterium]
MSQFQNKDEDKNINHKGHEGHKGEEKRRKGVGCGKNLPLHHNLTPLSSFVFLRVLCG